MSSTLPPMVERGLRRSFQAVPRRTRIMYDWNSDEGQRFLAHVDQAVRSGVSLDVIGEVIGIPNFAQRYSHMGRGMRGLL